MDAGGRDDEALAEMRRQTRLMAEREARWALPGLLMILVPLSGWVASLVLDGAGAILLAALGGGMVLALAAQESWIRKMTGESERSRLRRREPKAEAGGELGAAAGGKGRAAPIQIHPRWPLSILLGAIPAWAAAEALGAGLDDQWRVAVLGGGAGIGVMQVAWRRERTRRPRPAPAGPVARVRHRRSDGGGPVVRSRRWR